MNLSLNRRLLLASSLVLTAFFGVTGLVLERAYHNNAMQAEFDRLHGKVIALIAALEQQEDGHIYLANALAETRFFTTDSGLYGQAIRNDGDDAWYSPSTSGQHLQVKSLNRGQQSKAERELQAGVPVFVFSLGVSWEDGTPTNQVYTISVAEHRQVFDQQLVEYRQLLWGWLATVALVLLLVQGSILRWGLAPLRRVATELVEIKAGHQNGLQHDYPRELIGLTDNLNALLDSQRRQLQRYREALGDLAHSLKTPLALLRGSVEAKSLEINIDQRKLIHEQLDLMTQIVDYQLQRAAAAGRTALAAPVNVMTLVRKLLAALDKVYFDKGMSAECLIEPDLQVQVDQQDLMELLGNLIDNAYKYGRHNIVITAEFRPANETDASGLVFGICVEDDGPGIDDSQRENVLHRGVRGQAESSLRSVPEGQGIGLAVVQDIVTTYGGWMQIDASRWRGAKVCVCLPLIDV